MAEIVHLSAYRDQMAVQAGFREWHRRFGQQFDARTRLNDLSPATLLALAEPGEAGTNLFYGLIIGFMGHGPRRTFDSLDTPTQLRVVDIHLFLADQVRFEMMRRLGWLARYGATQYGLFDMVRRFDDVQLACRQDPPVLAPSHPAHPEYAALTHRDRDVFIRRLLPSALDRFQARFGV
ncbi:hypothetical protein [Desulfatitalea alkaliphila]|uniref:Uncharacterized protein n=1 Tax=Desulfatitalea alkaliphila TaxID=2929485 RepID=A0AA41R153_9BACT|nr:hypothetical protein [Desulfatitalea alkaliphila]MCJ8499968.1 hypothetical protein [Desulfatitalea alkaliphila]